MAKKCKCRNGKYSTRCCTSGRSTRTKSDRRKKATSSNMKKRLPEREGDPASVIIDRLRRRGQMYTVLTLTQGGLYSAALLMEHEAMLLERQAQAAASSGKRGAMARSATKMKRAQRLATAGRLTGRVASRGIPIVGQVMLAYDLYTVADWAFAKGRLPAGARDRS